MIKKILNEFFPSGCIICGKIYKNAICPQCYNFIKQDVVFEYINEKNFKLYYLTKYEKQIRKILLKFKFSDRPDIHLFFSEIISKKINIVEKIKEYDYIIPVPMHIIQCKKRGYNQAELIANIIGKEHGIRVLNDILVKNKNNERQSGLNKKDREKNVKNVYELTKKEILENKKILIIDDIYTTGNTISECRKTILKGKPKIVDALVLAKRN